MDTASPTTQLAFAYRPSKRADPVLLQAASLAKTLTRGLAVVVPFVLPADGPGCCGIRGRRWLDMLRELAEEDAARARQLLAETAEPHSVHVAEGGSVPQIIETFTLDGDRQLVVPRKAAGTVYTRASLRQTRRLVPEALLLSVPA